MRYIGQFVDAPNPQPLQWSNVDEMCPFSFAVVAVVFGVFDTFDIFSSHPTHIQRQEKPFQRFQRPH